ncbi:MAG TPA: nitrous oxide reductase family maturation protein NosD [Leptospiraceae bacterium]|nr:nitrous oxide reductase family maturation protein NosD [Leptospiraceae bacterium]HMY67571.1 nitrous oxide reductase family maturation protein NosD [Leptospiraceae bacterium]HNF16006.1 nitrous oxide reductase family maturation protein NosD [Leptospiraceae bacterium]HNF27390.1 nitrous oxide reductase family maturation protein NosD [Leptospiraceae bacterium]HNI98156.1 nitrous oxide reductase family maturation protein NosD [Leptospiraceae bacterium]
MNIIYKILLHAETGIGDFSFLSLKALVPAFIYFSFFFPADSAVIRVCRDCGLRSVQEGLKKAQAGDTLEVHSGTYAEGTVEIRKPLHLKGIGRPVIDGGRKGHVFDIQSDSVTVEGFKIVKGGVSDIREFAGIHTENIRDCRFINNELEDNAYGFYLAKTEKCTLKGNSSVGNAKDEVSGGNGIHLWYCTDISIIENEVRAHRDGLYLEFSNHLLIEKNFSTESIRYGLHFMFSSENRFYRNRFSRNSTGTAIMYSKKIEVRENSFEKSKDLNSYGILLKDISDSDFSGNVFQENTVGINADSASRNVFAGNQFKNNGWAVNMFGNCDDNRLVQNNFIGNVFDVSTNSRENHNLYERNYWDQYKGFDLNSDGTGDKPFLPVRFFGYWVSLYPFLMVLFQSPVIEFLETAERVFPVMSPADLKDNYPVMRKYTYD